MALTSPVSREEIEATGTGALSNPQLTLRLDVALLTGGFDRPYTFGLAAALVSKGIRIDVIGSDDVDGPEMHTSPNLRFLNLRGNHRAGEPISSKAWRVLTYYVRLLQYAAAAKPKTFHILWNNKFQFFDRTLLMLYYRLCGRRIVLTAHNVNAGKRDGSDGPLNRLTLRAQYRLSHHIFVHTERMKQELIQSFGVQERRVTVIPFGINNSLPETDLTSPQAKQQLGIRDGERTILFFGNIGPYKGLEYLVAAFQRIVSRSPGYRLIIAGKLRGGCQQYWQEIKRTIGRGVDSGRVIQRIEYIPDEETELYFKAADILVLPYTEVSQSGVLFSGYKFGLPVIAADVGSLREDIVQGRTGFLCRPSDPVDLARVIEIYFESDLFKNLNRRRRGIQDYASTRHSWDLVAAITCDVYAQLQEGHA